MSSTETTSTEPVANMLDLVNMLASALREGAPAPLAVRIDRGVDIHLDDKDDADAWVAWWSRHTAARSWRQDQRYTVPYLRVERIARWRGATVQIFYLADATTATKREMLLAQLAELDAEAVPSA